MKKAIVLFIGILLVLLMITPAIKGVDTEKVDVYIDPSDCVDDMLWSSKDDKIRIQVDSNIPVDVYIIVDDEYDAMWPTISNFDRASLSRENITSLDTNWTQPDDRTYYFIILNDNEEETAIVDYSYTDALSSSVEEAGEAIGTCCLGIIFLVVIIIVVIIVVIIFVVKKNGKEDTQQYQQRPPPPPNQ